MSWSRPSLWTSDLTPIHFDRDSLVISIPVCAFLEFNDKIHLRMALTTPQQMTRTVCQDGTSQHPGQTKVNLVYTPEIILIGTPVIYAMKSDHMPTVQPKHKKDCG